MKDSCFVPSFAGQRSSRWFRTLMLAAASVATLTAAGSAHAERRATDCGQTGWYAPSSWPGFKGCPTGLGLSGVAGATDAIPQFQTALSWPVAAVAAPPVFGADGTAYVGTADGWLYAINRNGGYVWWSYMLDRIRGAAAVGVDGTVYLASDTGSLFAVDPKTGTHKWSHIGLLGVDVYGAPAIGPDGVIYYGDSAGWLYAVYPDGRRKWATFLAGAMRASPVFSRDGRTLYIGDEFFKFRALDAQTGAIKWLSLVVTGDTSTAAVGDDGTVYVASSAGNIHALNPLNGNPIWTYPTFSIIHSSPALAPNGDIIVADVFGTLYCITPAGGQRWAVSVGGAIGSTPAIDKNGTIYIGTGGAFHFNVGAIGAILPGAKSMHAIRSSNGSELWHYDTFAGVASSPAISQRGTVYFGSDEGYLYGVGTPVPGTGGQTRPIWPEDSVRISLSTFPPNPTPITIKPAACVDPTTRFTKNVNASNPSFGVLSNVVLVKPECGGHLCGINNNTDDDTVFSQAQIPGDEAGLLSMPSDVFPNTNRNLPTGAIAGCNGTPPPAVCPIDPASVLTTVSCTLDADCLPQGPDFRCASVYLQNGTSGPVVTTYPEPPATPWTVSQAQPVMRCGKPFTSGTNECTGGAMPFVTNPAPLVGPVPARTPNYQNFPCHEVRECADPGALLADATPSCGGHPCTDNLTSALTGMPPSSSGSTTAQIPESAYFDRADLPNTKCKFDQVGNGEASKGTAVPGGKESGPGTSSNWGVNFAPSFTAHSKITPRAYGFFSPEFNVSSTWQANGIAFGKTIPIFNVVAGVTLDICNQNAGISAKLFGQDISAIVGPNKGPLQDATNKTACANHLIASAADLKWLKNSMVNAQQVFKEMRAGTKLSRAVCLYARDASLSCGAPTIDRATAFAIYDRYRLNYNGLYDNIKNELNEEITRVLSVSGGPIVNNGLKGTVDFLDGEQRFSIRVVNASIPIGPFQVVLVVEGGGFWGLNGALDYNLQLYPYPTSASDPFPTNPTIQPGVSGSVVITPEAGINVMLYVGVGIGISGIAGADVGLGGTVNLVDITTPITMKAEITRTAQGTDTRLPGVGFGEPSGILALKPNSRLQNFTWQLKSTMSARAQMTLLSGQLDARLRVYFLFASKSWKKLVAKLKGFTPPEIVIVEGPGPLNTLVEVQTPMIGVPQITFPEVPIKLSTDSFFNIYATPQAWDPGTAGASKALGDLTAVTCHPPVTVD